LNQKSHYRLGLLDPVSVVAVAATAAFLLAPSTTLQGLMILVAAVTFGWLAYHTEYVPEALVSAAYLGLLGVQLEIGSLNLRPNMFIAIIGIGWALRNKSRAPLFRLFLALNATYLLSTLLHPNAPFFRRGLADCFLLTINLAQYAIVLQSADLGRLLRVMFVSSSVCYSVLVFLCLLVRSGMFPSMALQELDANVLRLSLLGTTPAAYIVFTLEALLFYLCFFGFPFSKLVTMWCLSSHLLALAFSFSRAAWLAWLLVFALFWGFGLVRFPLRQAFLGTSVVALLLLPIGLGGYWYFSGSTLEALSERAQAISTEEDSVVDRLLLWRNMVEDWQEAPILGHGAHDYAKFREDPTQISENYTLELLHSGGIVTAGLFVFGILLLAWRTMPWSWADACNRPWSLPLLAGFTAMSLSALTNPAMTGGIYWIGAGLLVLSWKH
jgi:hypothetical protein